MVLRGCLEASLYGFFIAKRTEAKQIWLDRHEGEEALKVMKNVFQIRPIFEFLERTDDKLHCAIRELYERTIDLGAHPNPSGVLGTMKVKEDGDLVNFHVDYLTNDSAQQHLSLKTTAQVGIGALMLFRYVYPERFEIVGLYEEIKQLSQGL